ncbi:class I SAM-dependent methyltransferase [Poseidonocella sp. HB161398]|uniref:class I SAM-dependent methyltransferase n=1 Tax=Poseidonocella sp. HB161398 TaxID=2320855 RepID=UPI001108339C|nr:class I SAM-dependent methyltransferase [Poseidonocella sp. HB161398]
MAEFAEFGAREFDGWSDGGIVDAYVRHFVPITDLAAGKLISGRVSAGDTVLDLCCGQGSLTQMLAERGAAATGLDFSPEMLAKARQAAPGATIVEGDAAAMPFADGQFDTVLCNFGMMHIADQPRALGEIRRVLRPGGTFAMATWNSPAASPAFAAIFGALKAHADVSAAPAQPDLFAFADPGQARALLAAAQLEMAEHATFDAAWRLDRPEELFEIFLTATVGAGMLIRSQSAGTVEKIAAAIARRVSEMHAAGTGYEVPVSIALISATAR